MIFLEILGEQELDQTVEMSTDVVRRTSTKVKSEYKWSSVI